MNSPRTYTYERPFTHEGNYLVDLCHEELWFDTALISKEGAENLNKIIMYVKK